MLAAVQGVPNDQAELDRWAFHNAQAIQLIIDTISTKRGVTLPSFQLYPLPIDAPDNWLMWNSQAHTNINNALGLQSHDLIEVDFENKNQLEAWIYLNYQELLAASNLLGIGP